MLRENLHLFLQDLHNDERILFRKYERTYYKIISTNKAICFNENCIREKLCPKNLYRGGLTWHKRQTVEDLLRRRNVDNLRRIEDLKKERLRLYNEIKARLNEERLNEMDQIVTSLMENHSRIVDARLTKKLIT